MSPSAEETVTPKPVQPQEARPEPKDHLVETEHSITLNGQATRLSPGSRVRDQANRLVMAANRSGL